MSVSEKMYTVNVWVQSSKKYRGGLWYREKIERERLQKMAWVDIKMDMISWVCGEKERERDGGNGESILCLMEGEEGWKTERNHGALEATVWTPFVHTHSNGKWIHTYGCRDCNDTSSHSKWKTNKGILFWKICLQLDAYKRHTVRRWIDYLE